MKHFFRMLPAIFMLGLTLEGASQNYSLTVEEYADHDVTGVVGLEGMKTYRFYVDMVNTDDFLSSVFGGDTNPLSISTSGGFFNDAFATGAASDGVNPLFFPFSPTLMYDSFVTIGIESTPVGDEVAVSTLESPAQPWTGCFIAVSPLSGTDVLVNDPTGGAWYVLNGSVNGLPDAINNRVMIMQMTTAGEICATMNLQIFEHGDGLEGDVRPTFVFCGTGTFDPIGDGEPILGCTNMNATNYDAAATEDDGSCVFDNACNVDGIVVQAGSYFFSPADLNIDPGETVVWENMGGNHNANGTVDTQTGDSFDNPESFYFDPVIGSASGVCIGSYTFDVPGVYHYDCSVGSHASLGMVGTITVGLGGCADAAATNYEEAADYDDGSCEYSVPGCTDATACNYDMDATNDDGSCTYADSGYDCDGNCLIDVDEDGVCDEFELGGCTDSAACNYDSAATDDDGSCLELDECGVCGGSGIPDGDCDCAGTVPADGYDCDGNCLADADDDGVCDEFEVSGCTADNACNYDASATDDDGSCDYCSCGTSGLVLSSDYTITIEEYASDLIPGMTTYRFYQDMSNEDDFLSSIFGNDVDPFEFNTTEGFYNDPYATGGAADGVNPAFFGFFPSLIGDSWVTIGIESTPTGSEVSISTVESVDQPWVGSFIESSSLSGDDILINDPTGGAWYVLNGTPNGLPDATNNRVLFMQLTTTGSFSGTFNSQVFGNGNGSDDIRNTYTFDGVGVYPPDTTVNASGCTDPEASNYDAAAEYDDGSCEYGVSGCTDMAACNYDAAATDDDDSCTYAEENYDCDGNCLNDADGDGVCDELETAGCTDMAACNYDAAATDDDDSCTYAETNYDCDGNCLNDADGDGVCDELEIAGCTDMAACNYNAAATDDDDSCTYAEENYDCDGNCLNDADGDGVCDELEIAGCTDPEAENYDETATDDDGSCFFCEIVIVLDGVTDAADSEGAIDVTISGGAGVYLIEWTGPADFTSSDEDISELIAGVYVLLVTDENGCTETIEVVVGQLIDVNELDLVSFNLFPNPAGNDVQLQVPASEAGMEVVQIYDAGGRLVLEETLNNVMSVNIFVHDLASGMYQVRVQATDGRWGSAPLMIQR